MLDFVLRISKPENDTLFFTAALFIAGLTRAGSDAKMGSNSHHFAALAILMVLDSNR
jgi:hypothetical protein